MIKKHVETILTAITSEHTYMSIKGDKHSEYIKALGWLKGVYTGSVKLIEVPKAPEELVQKAPISKKIGKTKGLSKAKK